MHKKTTKNLVNNLVAKLAFVRRQSEAEHGGAEFYLFALFNRKVPGASNQWDLILAAPWLDPGDGASWSEMTFRVKAVLSEDDSGLIYRIVILDVADPTLTDVLHVLPDKITAPAEIENFTFSGVPIRRGYVIAAKGLAVQGGFSLRKMSTGEVMEKQLPNEPGEVFIPHGRFQVF